METSRFLLNVTIFEKIHYPSLYISQNNLTMQKYKKKSNNTYYSYKTCIFCVETSENSDYLINFAHDIMYNMV